MTKGRSEAASVAKAITMLSGIIADNKQRKDVQVGTQFQQVGIRNISSYTIGLVSPVRDEPDVQLAPFDCDHPNPESTAVISFPHWQALRKGQYIARGMIMRDDSSLGSSAFVGPADRPEDLASDFAKNAVYDPQAWIEEQPEDQLRERILAMTSEPSIRRLLAQVDLKIGDVGQQFKGQQDQGKLAMKALPARYRMVDELCKERLFELIPGFNRDFSQESITTIRF